MDEFAERIQSKRDTVFIEQKLDKQWRCRGGKEYTDYIWNLLNCNLKNSIEFENYELKLYRDVNKMVEDIKDKNKEYGLCRNVAGYAWPWATKKDKNAYDIK